MKMNDLDMTRIPGHIAIIMDGNGRWATCRVSPEAMAIRQALKRLGALRPNAHALV